MKFNKFFLVRGLNLLYNKGVSLSGAFLRVRKEIAMKRNYKIAAGILAVTICILPGCQRRDDGGEDLLLLQAQEETEISAAGETEEENVTSEADGREDQQAEDSAKDAGGRKENAVSGESLACVVHICGAVNRPGVYTMERGSRIYQAVEKAGGFTGDAAQDYLNQADLLTDGMKIYVPTGTEAEEAAGENTWLSLAGEEASRSQPEQTSSLININTAGEDALCSLPGVGSSKAKSIIAYRERNGAYRTIEDIMNVEGIKEGVFLKIKDKITV